MKIRLSLLSIIIFNCLTLFLSALPNLSKHTQVELLSEVDSIQPGRPFWVGLSFSMDADWHIYWENPGETGMATSIEWDLPKDFIASEIQWPSPRRFEFEGLIGYGYTDKTTLLVEITPSLNIEERENIEIKGTTSWLECADSCIPGSKDLTITLPVKDSLPTFNSKNHELFETTRKQFPQETSAWKFTPTYHADMFGILIESQEDLLPKPSDKTYFLPKMDYMHASSPQKLIKFNDKCYFLSLQPRGEDGPKSLEGILFNPTGWLANGSTTHVSINALTQEETVIPTESLSLTLAPALFFAFIGGLILNLMPCVFPILSIKILGFVQKSGKDSIKVKLHGLVFTLGVLLSFWALAGLLLLLRAGGEQLGWGFQLQSPVFLTFLCALLLLLALNFAGLFEIGTSFMGLGNKLSTSEGYMSSLSSGVLATILATPCTAPFMGSALGFALSQPPMHSMYIFSALGLGMATPYLALSFFTPLLRFLPNPGAWMETFKQAMAFPLLATVIWLLWVFAQQTSVNALAILLFILLLLSIAAWAYGRFSSPVASLKRQRTVTLISLSLIAVALFLGYQNASSEQGSTSVNINTAAYGGLEVQEYSKELLEELRTQNNPVYIDFTAAWCLTCQANKKNVFSSEEVIKTFREKKVMILVGDWTRYNPAITEAITEHGRSGVPLNVLYPSHPTADPIILPELLTPALVLKALNSMK